MFTMAKAKFGEGERTVEVLVVGNTAYVDDDFCAKAFPGDHVQVVAANEARRDGSSLHASWKELLQHLDQAYEFDRVVYLSTYLTPHTEAVGDIELLRSVFRACMGRQIQLLFVTGPMGADGAVDAAGQNGKGIICLIQSRGRHRPALRFTLLRLCRLHLLFQLLHKDGRTRHILHQPRPLQDSSDLRPHPQAGQPW